MEEVEIPRHLLHECFECFKLVQRWEMAMENPRTWNLADKIWKEYTSYICNKGEHTYKPKKNTHQGNGKPKGLFAGTLTVSPDDNLNEIEMVQAIKKIFNQQTCPVKKYAWYVEYTDAGLPHIHFCYETETGGRIHQKVFKRYWKNWDESYRIGKGFRGGYHKSCDSETAYLEYIAKDGGKHHSQGFE